METHHAEMPHVLEGNNDYGSSVLLGTNKE
jgi:hypothetical protein